MGPHTSLSPMRRGFVPGFVNYKKGALDSQVIVYQLQFNRMKQIIDVYDFADTI
jgi:hypothetical protein